MLKVLGGFSGGRADAALKEDGEEEHGGFGRNALCLIRPGMSRACRAPMRRWESGIGCPQTCDMRVGSRNQSPGASSLQLEYIHHAVFPQLQPKPSIKTLSCHGFITWSSRREEATSPYRPELSSESRNPPRCSCVGTYNTTGHRCPAFPRSQFSWLTKQTLA